MFFLNVNLFSFLKNVYWSIVDLQRCITFCCTTNWISYTYPNTHSFLDTFPMLFITEYWGEFPVLYSKFLLVINFIFKKIFYWRIITSQYCAGFYRTSTWINHIYIQLPSWTSLPSPTLLGCHRALDWVSCVTQQFHLLSILHMVIYVSMLFSQFVPPSPSPTVSTSLLFMSASMLIFDGYYRVRNADNFYIYFVFTKHADVSSWLQYFVISL